MIMQGMLRRRVISQQMEIQTNQSEESKILRSVQAHEKVAPAPGAA